MDPAETLVGQTLARYRIVDKIGAGGMGVVYKAYDERLRRHVAIKALPADEAEDPERVRRQLREARMASSLAHPGLVTVHDIVSHEGSELIVMELVPGKPLSASLSTDGLPWQQASAIALPLAEAIAAAHDAHIIHRDLKPSNVMVLPDEVEDAAGTLVRIKVLDFGLARPVRPPRPGEEAETMTQLTEDGATSGTPAYMSPEQSLGEPLDVATDVFSFGTLLYEMLAGHRPFTGAHPGELFHALHYTTPPPLDTLRGDVPDGLARLVEHILTKKPAGRPSMREVATTLRRLRTIAPQHAAPQDDDVTWVSGPRARPENAGTTLLSDATVTGSAETAVIQEADGRQTVATRHSPRRWSIAVTVLALTAVLAFLFRGSWTRDGDSAADRLEVVVPLTVTSKASGDEPAAHLLARAVHVGILHALLGLRNVSAFELDPRAEAQDPVDEAFAAGADEILSSHVDCARGTCQIVLSRLRGSDGAVLWVGRLSADATRLDLPADSLRVAEQVRSGFPDLEVRQDGLGEMRVGPEHYAAFLELYGAWETRTRSANDENFLAEIDALRAGSPDFVDAILFEARVRRQRFYSSRDREELDKALAAVEKARTLAPEDPRILRLTIDLALDLGDLDEAQASLEIAERLEPGDVSLMVRRALFQERRGQVDEARHLLLQAIERRPSWDIYSRLSNLAYRSGDIDAARRHLESAVERAPTHFDLRSQLAQLELMDGSPQRAAELYEKLVEGAPEETELSNLGVAYLLLENYEAATRSFQKALELAPNSPYVALNLADAKLLSGEEAAAHDLYQRVLERIAADPDPDALLTVRAQAQGHLGLTEEAVGSVQKALRLAPDNPQIAYEAALVHALVGDTASAVWQARRARELGIGERWFSFPWFDDIRARLDS